MHGPSVSQRVQSIKPSPTLAVTSRAARLRAEGRDIIGLGAGEPDFDTPEHIKEAAVAALRAGKTRYTQVSGVPQLRQAISDKLQRDNRLHYPAEQISVACGAKHSIYNLFQALLDPGDEVLIPAPYWVSYPDMAILAGARPVILSTDRAQGFKLRPEPLRAALGERARLLILNSPNNPTGMYYGEEELRALGAVLEECPGLVIITDDIYEHILWDKPPFVNIANVCPALRDRCVVVNGVSKAYAMTGWRIGYTAAPLPIIEAINKIQSQSTTNACSIAQEAAIVALNGDQSSLRENNRVFRQRHDFIHGALQGMDGVECLAAQGTFYIFPDLSALLGPRAPDDVALAEYFLEQAGVAMVPGSAFGAPGYMRISFATSMDNLHRAAQRLEQALPGLR